SHGRARLTKRSTNSRCGCPRCPVSSASTCIRLPLVRGEDRGSLISSRCRLTATIVITESDDDLDVPEYRFDLRQPDGALVWRHDCHPGHASDPGMTGPQHLHVLRGAGEVRLPEGRRTLELIREALVLANQQLAPEG